MKETNTHAKVTAAKPKLAHQHSNSIATVSCNNNKHTYDKTVTCIDGVTGINVKSDVHILLQRDTWHTVMVHEHRCACQVGHRWEVKVSEVVPQVVYRCSHHRHSSVHTTHILLIKHNRNLAEIIAVSFKTLLIKTLKKWFNSNTMGNFSWPAKKKSKISNKMRTCRHEHKRILQR